MSNITNIQSIVKANKHWVTFNNADSAAKFITDDLDMKGYVWANTKENEALYTEAFDNLKNKDSIVPGFAMMKIHQDPDLDQFVGELTHVTAKFPTLEEMYYAFVDTFYDVNIPYLSERNITALHTSHGDFYTDMDNNVWVKLENNLYHMYMNIDEIMENLGNTKIIATYNKADFGFLTFLDMDAESFYMSYHGGYSIINYKGLIPMRREMTCDFGDEDFNNFLEKGIIVMYRALISMNISEVYFNFAKLMEHLNEISLVELHNVRDLMTTINRDGDIMWNKIMHTHYVI